MSLITVEVPDIPPIYRVFLFPLGSTRSAAPVPGSSRSGRGFFLLPACAGCSWGRVLPAPTQTDAGQWVPFPRQSAGGFCPPGLSGSRRGQAAGKLAFLRFQKIRGMDFLGNILAVHLVQDILERRNIVVIPHGVDTVIHGDIAHTVAGERSPQSKPVCK